MLSHVNKYLALILLSLLMACQQNGKENKEQNQKILELSKTTIGKQEYGKVYQLVLDSLDIWCSEKLPAYESVWYYNYRLDSVLCFNSSKDRMVTGILIQCNRPTCSMDNISYFYGAKIKDQWYFFRGGGTMAILREHYQKDIHSPLSFEKLHKLALSNMLRGYIKKNATGEWEVNDAFFTHHFEGVNWGDFENQSHEDTVAYGKRFTNKKEYFESIYWAVIKGNWIREEKRDYDTQSSGNR